MCLVLEDRTFASRPQAAGIVLPALKPRDHSPSSEEIRRLLAKMDAADLQEQSDPTHRELIFAPPERGIRSEIRDVRSF